eukprot:440140-Amphidinium_carterae.1
MLRVVCDARVRTSCPRGPLRHWSEVHVDLLMVLVPLERITLATESVTNVLTKPCKTIGLCS